MQKSVWKIAVASIIAAALCSLLVSADVLETTSGKYDMLHRSVHQSRQTHRSGLEHQPTTFRVSSSISVISLRTSCDSYVIATVRPRPGYLATYVMRC
ncbi:MAG TPA: hypothetical protein VFA74_08525 [Terriglobales bacterium]|nr:hypothetical protein [Terriglobales bacterium]